MTEVELFVIDLKTILGWVGLAFNEKTGKKMTAQDAKTHRRVQSMLEAQEDSDEFWNQRAK